MTLFRKIDYLNNRVLGQCDARCYNADGHYCTCICNGINHGRGLYTAINNTAKNWTALTHQHTQNGTLLVPSNEFAQSTIQFNGPPND